MEKTCIEVESPDFLEYSTNDSIADTSPNILINVTADSSNIWNPSEIKELSEDTQELSFKSDHPALKTNNDYKKLLKAVAVLETQKARAIKDLDLLHELKEKALADPIAFVERLQRGDKISFPPPQNVCPIPVVDWNKYMLNTSSNFSRRQSTRSQDLFKSNPREKRSQLPDQKPAQTHHYWSAEEQKKLEELLEKFPPEKIETRRWEKIANCLENRTPIQVASRVQKYFIALLKAGRPIPGRMPNLTYLKRPRRNLTRDQPSTFLVSHSLPVYMPDEEEKLIYSYNHHQPSEENSLESKLGLSDKEEFAPEVCETSEYKELLLLRKIQRDKLQCCGSVQHIDFNCYS